jgi:hypothetical protein
MIWAEAFEFSQWNLTVTCEPQYLPALLPALP